VGGALLDREQTMNDDRVQSSATDGYPAPDWTEVDAQALAGALVSRLAGFVPAELTVTVQDADVSITSDRGHRVSVNIGASVSTRGPLAERLRDACERALNAASEAIVEETLAAWPVSAHDRPGGAEVGGGEIRLWYGRRSSPYIELHAIPLREVLRQKTEDGTPS
jgi:hypothetical protein